MPDTPYRAIADSTYDWETWVDETGAIRWINPGVERLTGLSAEACIAMPAFPMPLVHPDDRARIADVWASAARGESGNDIEFRVVHRDGRVRWVAISYQPLEVPGGATRGFRTSVRDIDARKQSEERLREAERRASRLARDQAELLATLSHELRSPLHCISGFGELIERRVEGPELRGYVQIVREQSDAALRMVEDLLHFVSLAESHVTLRAAPFDLRGLVEREIEATRPRVREGVRVSLEVEAGSVGVVVGDPDRVRQIIANLLSNAARFTEHGAIDVLLGHDADGLVIEVRDTGIGMSKALLARVKDPFVQGAPSASSRGGVGLGLAIVDRLVAAMGGTLTLASSEGHGTSALVRLPLPRAKADALPGAPEVPAYDLLRLAGLRVLVVDDSEPARTLLSAMFGTFGPTPDLASSGRQAIERARAQAYDLVVLDYHMPDLDGVATAKRLRAVARRGARPPVLVLLTANVLASAFADPAAHGIDLVLAKPLRLAQVGALAASVAGADVAPGSLEIPLGPAVATEDGVDREVAAELCSVRAADGRTLLARTLPRVEGEVRRVLGMTRAALRDAALDAPAILRELHTLKGLVASIGAAETAERVAALEGDLRAHGGAGETESSLDAIEETFARAHAVLVALAE